MNGLIEFFLTLLALAPLVLLGRFCWRLLQARAMASAEKTSAAELQALLRAWEADRAIVGQAVRARQVMGDVADLHQRLREGATGWRVDEARQNHPPVRRPAANSTTSRVASE